jgi:Zn-dependent protease
MKGRWVVSPSFYVFWAIFCLLDTQNVLPVFVLAAVIHELGHAAAIVCLGGHIACIRLHAAGAVMVQSRLLSDTRECIVALAGPAAGLLAAVLFASLRQPMCAGANLLLSLFNLLPILPLDGGAAVRSLLRLLPSAAAQQSICLLQWISVLAAFALTVFGGVLLYQTGSNPTGLAVGICLLGSHAAFLRDTQKYAMITKNRAG